MVEVCSFQDGLHLSVKAHLSSKYSLEVKKEVGDLSETSGPVYQVKRFHIQKDPFLKICIVEEPKISRTSVEILKKNSDIILVFTYH